jgi:hypothetical protein
MSSLKEKSTGFIIGIMVGLIVAGGFFILKLDNYFKELNFYKTIVKSLSSESKVDSTETKEDTISTPKSKRSPVKKEKKSLLIDLGQETPAFEEDTLPKRQLKDSLTSQPPLNDDEIVVRKDELLATKTLDVINLTPAKSTAKDSLLQKVSGIKEEKNPAKQYLNIECWASPLNYRGYKLGRYKMIAYGFASADGMKVFKLDELMYLKTSFGVYRLDYATGFKPYERVTDEAVLSKLK